MKSFGKVKYRRYAFTLAEVLITITVIGVVAALTIPNLINNYQNRAWNTASVVFQRKLGEALKVMNSQGTLAGYSSTEDFVNELSKHIKITKICKNDEITSCFEDTVLWGDEEIEMRKIKYAKNFSMDDWGTKTVGLMFSDGVSGVIAYNPECVQDPYRTNVINVSDTGIGTNCIALLYDTSGFKKPNTQSKDLRGLNVNALESTCSIELPDGTCFTSLISFTPISNEECAALQQETDVVCCRADYCAANNDYWGGAFKACHDMGSRLPTDEELASLAKTLYPSANITTTYLENSLGTRENAKAIEMGFITSNNQSFNLWGNSADNLLGYGRSFQSNLTIAQWYNGGRRASDVKAVCIGY